MDGISMARIDVLTSLGGDMSGERRVSLEVDCVVRHNIGFVRLREQPFSILGVERGSIGDGKGILDRMNNGGSRHAILDHDEVGGFVVGEAVLLEVSFHYWGLWPTSLDLFESILEWGFVSESEKLSLLFRSLGPALSLSVLLFLELPWARLPSDCMLLK